MSSTIAAGVRVEGLVEADGDLVVEGAIEGRIAAGGKVTIAAGASCRSSVRSPRLVIVGELIGNAMCTVSIDVAPGARVVGDLRAPDIQVGANAEVDGRVDVLAPEPDSRRAERTKMDARGVAPMRPEPPSLGREIPRPPRPSGRVSITQRGGSQ